jgi:uncharacterized DUF497 family protein
MNFEWDEIKNRANQRKHGLTFEVAQEVFSDPLALVLPDPGFHDEIRWRIIGKVRDLTIILVVFVERGDEGEHYRLISARRVTSYEKRKYEEG